MQFVDTPFGGRAGSRVDENSEDGPMSISENKERIRRIETAVNNRDTDALGDILADGFVLQRELEEIHGLDGYIEYLERLFGAFPDLTVSFDEIIAEDDTVVVRYSVTGTHEGEYKGVQPTGEQVTISGVRIARFDDGKVTEAWDRANNLELLGQLDVVELPTE